MTAMAVLTEESVEKLAAVLDRVCEKDPAALSDGDTIEALHRQLARLEAATARAAAAFDVARGWEADGARSAAAWISTRCRRPLGEARRRVAAGRRLRDMPQVDAAWTAGDISASHVDVLGRAWTPASAQLFARDEQLLCEEARQLRFHHFVQVVAYWRYRADPDGVEADAAAQRDGRRVYLSKGRAGMRFLDGVLDPIGGAIVEKVLADIEDELFRHDWAEATARRGEHARASDPGDPRDLGRTPAQRRADALVEMARRAASAPLGARLPEPLFSVLVGYETFAGPICQLAGGTVVSPGSLVPYLDQAWVERVVFDGPSRVTDVGVRRRLFEGATRRAVELRDQECYHPYCDAAAEDCQVDHIQPWASGGLTVQANGRPACPFHNRGRHRRT